VVGPFGHAPSRTFPLNSVEVAALPHGEFVCLAGQQYYGSLRLLTWLPFGFSLLSLYHQLRSLWTNDQMRPLLFHRLLPNIPRSLHGGFFTACDPGLFAASVAFAFVDEARLPLFPFRANISVLQASRYVAGCWFAPHSLGDTSASAHPVAQMPRRLLHGLLVVTTTGLAPVSRR